ncbi:hypothetical protein BKA70DRAFT_1538730 [Coprinopsis sp. MPI-PUGE-AT-0042]|nr:hypothetical protein BKA70DRAFT_1538730 [Coprinopsis sp. MPI-PUGE-AT-0042]
MALAQPVARLGGPLWEEEVVPALRKRLESESRTLSKRMSAISLASDDGSIPTYTQPPASSTKQYDDMRTHARKSSKSSAIRSNALTVENSGSGSSSDQSRVSSNTAKAAATSSNFHRSRTYSQPDIVINGSSKGSRNNRALDSSKESDSKQRQPTRIPKPSRAYGALSNGNTPVMPQTNGFQTYSPHHTPDAYDTEHDFKFPPSATHQTVVLPNNRSASGLMHETAPFPASPSASTLASYPNGHALSEEAPSQPSIDSEERPFEHWYRGEVSRNGGVGELRVGRQQEMLEIANYGHMMRGIQGKKPSPGWNGGRRRAGSIGGLTEMERQRGSMDAVARVLDEHPLTDFEGESDVASLSSRRYHADPDYASGAGDVSMATVTSTMTSPAMSDYATMDERSTTPQPRLSESRNGQYPPSRIPSRQPRRSTDSRSTTPTMHHPPTMNGSYSQSKTPSPPSVSGNRPTSTAGKKGVSPPASGKKRTPVKSLRGKQAPPALSKKQDTSKDSGREASQYPVPSDGEGDMSHAIPTWTQPVPRAGNWDEVVLPVVARQKGMDEYYQTADGSPQARKVDTTPAPAPGTFGYDGSKYRRRGDNEPIEMDEFGRPPPGTFQLRRSTDEPRDEQAPQNNDEFQPYDLYTSAHDETRLPVRPSPSPMPFAEYAPKRPAPVQARPSTGTVQQQPQPHQPSAKVDQQTDLDDEKAAGCCKCTIM